MARRNKRRNKKKGNQRAASRNIMNFAVRDVRTITLIGGNSTFTLTPSQFNGSTSLYDIYEFWRIKRLRYRLHPNAASRTAIQVAAYVAGIVDSGFTPGMLLQLNTAAILATQATLPSAWRTVPPSALASYMTWYKTVQGTPDPAEEQQGNVFLSGAGVEVVTMEIEVVYEFRTLVNTGLTPQERGAQQMEQERLRILRIIGSGVAVPTQPVPAPARPPTVQ